MHALLYHLGDAEVREAIVTAGRDDPSEQVRAVAERAMPKVQHFEDREEAVKRLGAQQEETAK